jgi:hypothetical protein
MSEIYKTLNELNILFQIMLLDMLGYEMEGSPEEYSQDALKAVRVSWPTTGAPAFKITEDVVFIQTTEDDDRINRQKEFEYTRAGEFVLDEKMSYTRVVNLGLVLYGPNSFEMAQTIRDNVFRDVYRLYLNRSKIYPIPDIVAPRRAPELFAGQWWERVDLELRFNEKIVKEEQIGVIEIADIVLLDHSGVLMEIEVTESGSEDIPIVPGGIITDGIGDGPYLIPDI